VLAAVVVPPRDIYTPGDSSINSDIQRHSEPEAGSSWMSMAPVTCPPMQCMDFKVGF